MIVVDSTVWIDYLRDVRNWQTEWLDRAVAEREIGIIDLVLCEVLQGARTDPDFRQLERELGVFHLIESGGKELAIASAKNYRALRRSGVTVRKTIDCLIATICLRGGHTLLHNDSDFDGFEKHLNLNVVQATSH